MKFHPDKFPDLLSRGEQYVLFMTNGVGIINTAMDVVTTKATEVFTSMGLLTTRKFSRYTHLHPRRRRAGNLQPQPHRPLTGPRKRLLAGWTRVRPGGVVLRLISRTCQ